MKVKSTCSHAKRGNKKNLDEVCDILDSQRKPLNKNERENRIKGKELKDLYPYYGATQQAGYIDDYLFDEELILLGEDGVMFYDRDKPKAYLISGKSWVNNHAHVLRVKKDIAVTNYVLYFLNIFNYHGYVTGSTRLKLNRTKMSKIQIPLPSLEEQQKITKKLDKTKELIDLRKSSIKKLDELSKALFIEIFGDPVENEMEWEVDILDNVCDKITDGTHHSPPMQENGFKYITAKHIKENKLEFENKATYVSKEEHNKIYARCNPSKGDVLYIKDGATTGIACLNPYDEEFSLLSSVALLKSSKKIISTYIVYYLNNKSVKDNILRNMAGGAIKRLTIKKIKNISITTPPLPIQQKFAKRIEKIEAQKALYEEELKRLEDLFESLLSESFA